MTSTAAEADAWEAPTTALEAGDQHPWRRHWRWWLWIAVLLGSVACLLPITREAKAFRALCRTRFFLDPNETGLRQHLSETLSTDQQLVLFGDDSKGWNDRWESLSKRFPDRPDYYAQHACAHVSEQSSLPTDFSSTAARIAPGNAWFPLFAAAVNSREVVNSRPQTKAQIAAHAPKEWDVYDEPRLAECMATLHQAAGLSKFEPYTTALIAEKLALVPPADRLTGQLSNHMFAVETPTASFRLQALSKAVAAKAWLLANHGDKEEFKRLVADWIRVVRLQASSDEFMIESLVTQAQLTGTLPNLSDGAARLGLVEEAARLKEANDRAQAISDARRTASHSASQNVLTNHGGLTGTRMIASLSRMVEDAPVPTPAEMEPGRRVDQSLFHRGLCLAAFPLVFLVCGACALYRFRSGPLPRRLSARLTGAMSPVDWAWILASAVLPSIHLAILYGLTPLGGRDWGYYDPWMVPKGIQLAGWFLLTLATPVVAARWRLRRRLPGLTIASGSQRGLGIMIALGYASVAVTGIYYLSPHPGESRLASFFDYYYTLPPDLEWPAVAAALLLPLFLWGLTALVRAVFTHSARALDRQVIARLLVPAWIFLLLPVATLIPICRAQERYWVPRDTLLQPTATFTAYEGAIASRLNEQTLRIIRLMEPAP